jgi:alpha-L-fucosidase
MMIPDARLHPDLYGNALVTQRTNTIFEAPDPTPVEEARMMARHRQQLVELLSNYGKIDMMCLDNWLGKKDWPELRETIKTIRKIQPDVMLRARGIGNYGDYYTPEGFVPGNKENTNFPWFVIYPLGESFSYEPDEAKYKGGKWIIDNLVDAVAKGGRFMVGIGPDENGRFHPQAIEDLRQAGDWLKMNGESIYATRPRDGEDWREGRDIRFTRSKDGATVYAIALKWPGEKLILKTVRPKADSKIMLLGSSTAMTWSYAPEQGLVITLPSDVPKSFAYSFKINMDAPAGN